ncbi:hypothetical protein ACIQ34_10725 [Ureibacillus sp. NPDC094379]
MSEEQLTIERFSKISIRKYHFFGDEEGVQRDRNPVHDPCEDSFSALEKTEESSLTV